MNKQCVNRPGATDHTTAECPVMVEASAVVNQQVTTAAVAPDALEQARRHLSNAIEDAEDGKTAAALPALREVAHYLAHAAAPTVKAEQVDDLSAEVESMVRALEEGEWAEHAGQTEIGARLESAITTLINRLPAPSLPAAVSADLTRVKCPCCPYEYDADSYDAGFIAGRGMCQVCDAAMPPKDLPAAGSADVGKFSVQCGVCKESSTLDDRKELSGCCWACGHEIDLDSQLRAALSAQQSAQNVSVPTLCDVDRYRIELLPEHDAGYVAKAYVEESEPVAEASGFTAVEAVRAVIALLNGGEA